MTHSRADRLVRGVVPDSEVRVVERLLAGDALRGVEVEHLREQVERERVGLREELLERHAGLDGERANVVLGLEDMPMFEWDGRKGKLRCLHGEIRCGEGYPLMVYRGSAGSG